MKKKITYIFALSIFAIIIVYSLWHKEIFINHQIAALASDVTTQQPEIIKPRNVFYNRVGKCGSRTLLQFVRILSKANNFTTAGSSDFQHDHPSQQNAKNEMEKIARLKLPAFYDRHIHFLDFEKYGFEQPIYINVIRDPIERFASHYNYAKYGDGAGKVKHPEVFPDMNDCVMQNISRCNNTSFMFYIGLYFCGMEDVCLTKSHARVELAKKHIDENYLVIGLKEEFENTLKLFERMLPTYFKNATLLWKQKNGQIGKNTKTKRKEVLTEESVKKLRKFYLVDEYEVYNYAKEKYERLKREYGVDQE